MNRVPLMRDAFLEDEATRRQLAAFVKASPRLSMGPKCAEFEAAFSTWQGRAYSVLFNSGSSANLALIQALINLGLLERGDRVGVSALTWATNVMPIGQLGLVPVACDTSFVHYGTMPMPREDADLVFVTHALGFPALSRGFVAPSLLIEDCCESLGTETEHGRVGNFGLASTFSFFVGHHLSTIEGGMVCTDDPALADMLRMVRAHGWDRNVSTSEQLDLRKTYNVGAFDAGYTFYAPGYNLRPTEITGFLGLTQLPLMDKAIARREAIYTRLAEARSANPDFLRHDRRHIVRLSAFCFPMVCVEPGMRAGYVERFMAVGVEVRPLIAGNIQRQPFWTWPKTETPGADLLHDQGFYCACRPDMTEEELTIIEGVLA